MKGALLALFLVAVAQSALGQTQLQLNDCINECGADNVCFLMCGFCATPTLRIFLPAEAKSTCTSLPLPGPSRTVTWATSALLNSASVLHGFYFNEPGPETNATLSVAHLLRYMPRRDLLQVHIVSPHFYISLSRHILFSFSSSLSASIHILSLISLPFLLFFFLSC